MDIQEKPIIQFIGRNKNKICIPVIVKNGDKIANVIALLDTGAENVFVRRSLFDSLELKRIRLERANSVNDKINVITSKIEIAFCDGEKILTDFQEVDCSSPIIDLVDTSNNRGDIILGMNFITKYKWFLNPNDEGKFIISVYPL